MNLLEALAKTDREIQDLTALLNRDMEKLRTELSYKNTKRQELLEIYCSQLRALLAEENVPQSKDSRREKRLQIAKLIGNYAIGGDNGVVLVSEIDESGNIVDYRTATIIRI